MCRRVGHTPVKSSAVLHPTPIPFGNIIFNCARTEARTKLVFSMQRPVANHIEFGVSGVFPDHHITELNDLPELRRRSGLPCSVSECKRKVTSLMNLHFNSSLKEVKKHHGFFVLLGLCKKHMDTIFRDSGTRWAEWWGLTGKPRRDWMRTHVLSDEAYRIAQRTEIARKLGKKVNQR